MSPSGRLLLIGLAYVGSLGAGHWLTRTWSDHLHTRADSRRPGGVERPFRDVWILCWLGVLERALITTLIAFDVSGAASFIGTWVLLKSATGWQTWVAVIRDRDDYPRIILFTGILGSLMSVLVALVFGLVARYALSAP